MTKLPSVRVSLETLVKAPQYQHILRLSVIHNALQNIGYLLDLVNSDHQSGQLVEKRDHAVVYLIVQNTLHLAAGIEVLPQLFNEMNKGRPFERFLKEDPTIKDCVERLRTYLPESEKYKCVKGAKYDEFENHIKTMRDAFGAHVASESGGKILKQALKALIQSLQENNKPAEGLVIKVDKGVIHQFTDDVITSSWQVHGLKFASNTKKDEAVLRLKQV